MPKAKRRLPHWVRQGPDRPGDKFPGLLSLFTLHDKDKVDIDLTAQEYVALKSCLAKLRGYAVPEAPPAA